MDCLECDAKVKSGHAMAKHVLLKHDRKISFNCGHCNAKISSLDHFEEHNFIVHGKRSLAGKNKVYISTFLLISSFHLFLFSFFGGSRHSKNHILFQF